MNYIRKILTSKVYDVVKETQFQHGKYLSDKLNNNIYLKREDLQDIFSFKIRGAYNKIANLSKNETENGIIACSSGNHAQGVAYSSKKLGIKSTIVMPTGTSEIKINSAKNYGSNVLLFGENFDEAHEKALDISKKKNIPLIHPFDDPLIIAGQGTIGLEICKQILPNKLDYVFCCIGGGGLISGISLYIKTFFPEVKIIGVEEENSTAMFQSIKSGKIIELENLGFFADGSAVKKVGENTLKICSEYLDSIEIVSINEICSSIRDVYHDTRTIMEPSGILSLSGAEKYIMEKGIKDKNIAIICSGANMDFNKLRYISENSDINEKHMLISINDVPGEFLKLYDMIYPMDICEFNYRYNNSKFANIFFSVKANNGDYQNLLEKFKKNNINYYNLDDDLISKQHFRYQNGGQTYQKERVFTFEFPEKPGSLKKFLDKLDKKINISIFHYRNRGGNISSVLVGINNYNSLNLKIYLDKIGYKYTEYTNNPIYNLIYKQY